MSALLLFLGMAIVMLFVGWLAGRKQTDEGFHLYERKLPGWLFAVSYSAMQIGAGFVVVGTAYVYQYGAGFLWVFFGLAVGIAVAGMYSAWLRRQTTGQKLYTFVDYMKFRFGAATGKVFAWVTFFLIAGDLAIQLVSGGQLLEQLGVAPYASSIILTVVVIGLYLWFSGFRAVVWTDVVLLLCIVALTAVLSVASLSTIHSAPVQPIYEPVSISLLLSFLLYGALSPFSNFSNYQRTFSGKDEKTVRKGTWWSIAWIAIPAVGIVLIGFAARIASPNIDPDFAFLNGLRTMGLFAVYGGSVLLWAALMSSADTSAFVGSQVFSRNILEQSTKRRNVQMGVLVTLAIALLLSFLVPSVVKVGILFLGAGICVSVPLFAHWFIRLSGRAMTISVIGSLLSMIAYSVFIAIEPQLVLLGIAVSTVLLVLVSVVEKIVGKKI